MSDINTTYTQLSGRKPFDWFKALEAKNIKTLSIMGASDLSFRSSNWVTCAVGNQCGIIPRDNIGRPIDEKLLELGNVFSHNITALRSHINWPQDAEHFRKIALETLNKIEQRSSEIIKEIVNSQ